MKKTLTFKEGSEIRKLINLFAKKTGCNTQHNKCPCNTCFHSIDADFNHICWLIILGLRGDYDTKELLEGIKEELNNKEEKNER